MDVRTSRSAPRTPFADSLIIAAAWLVSAALLAAGVVLSIALLLGGYWVVSVAVLAATGVVFRGTQLAALAHTDEWLARARQARRRADPPPLSPARPVAATSALPVVAGDDLDLARTLGVTSAVRIGRHAVDAPTAALPAVQPHPLHLVHPRAERSGNPLRLVHPATPGRAAR